ncbi:MAG: helix-turn-helix domain-containing protein [Ginsengibacter sp.]
MAKSKFQYEIILLVKAKREDKGFSQADIADHLKVTPGYIGQVESIKSSSRYSQDQLNSLAIFLNCSPKDFMPATPIKDNGPIKLTKSS